MKFILYSFLAICFALCTGCGSKKSYVVTNQPQASILLSDSDSLFSQNLKEVTPSNDFILSEVESIETICLETSDKSLIGRISTVEITDSLIIVADDVAPGKVLAFNLDGTFSHQIGSVGEGPEDYSSINQVFIANEAVCIFDWKKSKLLTYELTGKFISAIEIARPERPENIYPTDGGYIGTYAAYFERNPFNIRTFGMDGVVTGTALPFKYTRPNPAGHIVKDAQLGQLFYTSFCDTIYSVTDSVINAVGRFGLYGPDDVPNFIEATSALDNRDYYRTMNTSSDIKIVNYIEMTVMPDVWYIEYQTPQYCYSCIVDPLTFKSKRYLRTDMSNKFCYFPFVTVGKDGASSLLSYMDEDAANVLSEENLNYLRECFLAKGCNFSSLESSFENDNPIIIKFNLKTSISESNI
ncbi:MAG: 6-bladed beta-propeller [Duncaniella sp.]|nr:6-bladed beta-propeller [Duncaniella sp.]